MTRPSSSPGAPPSGIGLELAKLFAADGSRLVLVARSRDKLTALADELKRTARRGRARRRQGP